MEYDIACRGVLFDCDGVLVDSTADGERSWTRWAHQYGLDPERVLDGVHGRRSTETVGLFLSPDRHDEGLRRIEQIEIEEAANTPPISGAAQLMAALPGNWAIVTSASRALLAARLHAAGLPTAPVLVTGDDVTVGKPAPDGYLQAAAGLGLPVTDCVVFEDSLAGVRAGFAAGAGRVVGVGPRALGTDARTVVRDLEGIRWSDGALHLPDDLLRRPAPTSRT